MRATVGQLLVNEALPEEYRDYTAQMDKGRVKDIARAIAATGNGELYRDTFHKLYQVGSLALRTSGRPASLSIYDLRTPPKTKQLHDSVRRQVFRIAEDKDLSQEAKEKKIIGFIEKQSPKLTETLMKELEETSNPVGTMVLSGSRGSPGDITSIFLGDQLVTDHRGDSIAMPMMTGFATGVTPAEYWASTYGARKGGIATKLATQETGAFGKQLLQVAHRIVVTEDDCKTHNGIPVAANDQDNVGTVLAQDHKDIPAGTILTPELTSSIGDDNITVRSVLTCEAEGTCSKCAGIRETGKLPQIGDNLGVPAAHSISERVTQAALRVKHTGGRKEAGKDVSGFDLFNQIIQVPKHFKDRATVADVDGRVDSIKEAPQGGYYININEQDHYVYPDTEIFVKEGDHIEAGQVLTDGIPNPRDLVKHRGIGDGRMQFINTFSKAFEKSGFPSNRRNLEILAKGLVNHVAINDINTPYGLPDDVVEYSVLARNYTPREGSEEFDTSKAKHKYLEKPALHYSIGTRLTPSVIKNLTDNNVGKVLANEKPPPFDPEMVRAMDQLTLADDWTTRLGGSYLQRGLLNAVQRGVPSDIKSTSYMNALVRGKGFGTELTTTGKY